MVKDIRSKKLKKETDTETEKKKLNKAPERRDGGNNLRKETWLRDWGKEQDKKSERNTIVGRWR